MKKFFKSIIGFIKETIRLEMMPNANLRRFKQDFLADQERQRNK